MRLHVFNPDSDLSLAHEAEMRRRGLPRAVYTAKPRAQSLARSLALLPAWLAAPGDAVLVNAGDDALDAMRRHVSDYGLGVDVVSTIPAGEVTYAPWGWCNTVAHRLRALGAREEDLTTRMDDVARLASREITTVIHAAVAERLGTALCLPPVIGGEHEVAQFLAAHPCGSYLKKLWSGSGQGVLHVPAGASLEQSDLRQWLQGELRRVGRVACEPAYDRVMDMAVEYRCDRGVVSVAGYSVFAVDAHNQWVGTVVDTRETLHDRIVSRYPDFDRVVDALTAVLTDIVPAWYDGYTGIDMLLWRDGDTVGINPCVEMNFRTTMGVVAAVMGERYGMRGTLRIVAGNNVPAGAIALTPPAAFTAIID